MPLQEAAFSSGSKGAERRAGGMERERWIEEYQNVGLSEILAAPQRPAVGTPF